MRRLNLLGCVATSVLLSACVANGPPPVTSLAGRSCAAAPDLSTAQALTPGKDAIRTVVDGNTACIETTAGKATYAAYKLTDPMSPALIDIFSEATSSAVLTPRVQILGADGQLLREISRDNFVYRGSSLHLAIRQQPGDTFLLALSDSASVGQSEARLTSSTQVIVVPVGLAMVPVNTGADAQNTRVFSHTGTLVVGLRSLPKN
jgi:hypothetical protein